MDSSIFHLVTWYASAMKKETFMQSLVVKEATEVFMEASTPPPFPPLIM